MIAHGPGEKNDYELSQIETRSLTVIYMPIKVQVTSHSILGVVCQTQTVLSKDVKEVNV